MKKFLKIFYIVFFTLALLSSKASAVPTFVDSFSVHSQETRPNGLTFNNDGTKMFVTGHKTDDIEVYKLTTGFDISTATHLKSFPVDSEDDGARDVKFNSDGTKMFYLGGTNDKVYEYKLTTAFDVSSRSYVDSFSVSPVGFPEELEFSPDGTKMFVLDNTGDDVNEFKLTTGFDISTASYVQTFSVQTQENTPTGLAFTYGGTKMFVTGWQNDTVIEYTLSTAFDISTASFVDTYAIADAVTNHPSALTFSSDASKMFIMGRDESPNEIYEYTLSCYYGVINCIDPTSDKDDVASIEAQAESAKKLIQHTADPVLNRMEWLRRNTDNANLTNQNIEFQFSNTILQSLSKLIPAYLNNKATTSELKELETIRDKRKKLISENAELESQNEKLKLLAKQKLLAELKDQENKSTNNWSFWSEGTVRFGKIGDSIISSAKNIKTSAITIGADIKTANNKMFGMALRIGADAIDFGNVKNSLDLDTVSLTLYESLLFGKNTFMDSLIGIGTFTTDVVNAVGYGSTKGKRDGNQIFASFKIRETIKRDKLNFTPNVKIDLGFSTLSDYSEEGLANLKFNRQNIGTIITSIGGTLDNIIDLNGGTLKPFLEMDYYADISPSSEQKISYKNDTNATYKLLDIKGSTHNLKGKLGFDYMTDTGWTFTSSYQRIQNKGNGYSDGLYLEVNYLPSKDIEYAMSLDNDKASLDYKKNINGLDFTIGSNYSLVSEMPDYGVNVQISNTF